MDCFHLLSIDGQRLGQYAFILFFFFTGVIPPLEEFCRVAGASRDFNVKQAVPHLWKFAGIVLPSGLGEFLFSNKLGSFQSISLDNF